MRILFATDGIFPSSIGGMQRHSFFLANHLAGLGADLDVLYPSPASKHFSHPNIREYEVPHKTYRFLGHYVWECWEYSQRISDFIKSNNEDYDAAYGQGFTLWNYLPRRKFPCVIDPHGLEMFQTPSIKESFESIPFRAAMRYQTRYADRVVSKGGKLTQILEKKCRLDSRKITELPNGVDLEYVDRMFQAESKIPNSFLFVGRLAANKGLEYLIRAFLKLRTPAELFIIGEGPLKSRLEQTACSAKIRFLGKVSDEELYKWYARSGAFVLPTLYEGMPTVILEAMACGLPIAATDVGAIPQMVDDANGLLIPAGDEGALTRALEELLQLSTQAKSSMGNASRQRVKNFFSWNAIAKKTLEVLAELCHKS